MTRELAKDRELSFGIQDLMDSRTGHARCLTPARRLEKNVRGGGSRLA
jgi:hypothetical protein